jgi:hypothetical protein
MNKQDNTSPPKVNNSNIRDWSNGEAKEITNNELRRLMIGMMNKTKEVMYKYSHEFKENSNK